MDRIALVTAAVFLALSAASPLARADESAEEALSRLERKRRGLSTAQYTQTTRTRSGEQRTAREQRIYERGWGKNWRTRVENFESALPPGKQALPDPALLTVFDGQTLWTELPSGGNKVVVKSDERPQTRLDEIRQLLRDGRARAKTDQPVADHPCTLIEVIEMKRLPIKKASYWVSDRSGIVLRSIILNRNGSVTETEVADLLIDVPIKDELLSYAPGEGATVMDATRQQAPKKRDAGQ